MKKKPTCWLGATEVQINGNDTSSQNQVFWDNAMDATGVVLPAVK
jgi:hypothetical protein